jgi:hypothetical protein
MADAWYEGTKSDEDRLYEGAVKKIKGGVKGGLTFEQAASLVDVKDPALRDDILDTALKVLIAEAHFEGKVSLEDLAKKLALPVSTLIRARDEMMKDVEAAAVEKYKESIGQKGEA